VKDKIFSIGELQEDFQQMRDAIENLHPALYKFANKQDIDRLFEQKSKKICTPMNIAAFYKIVLPIVAKIGCGHTRMTMPEHYWDTVPRKIFPLGLIFIRNKVYVVQYYGEAGEIPLGAEVSGINGMKISEIFRILKTYISADGYNDKFKTQLLSRKWFNCLYAIHFGFQNEFTVTYQLPGSSQSNTVILEPIDGKVLNTSENKKSTLMSSSKDNLNLELIVDKNTAILSIRSFAYYSERAEFYSFIEASFKKIEDSGIKNLILDFRDNGGGDPYCTTHLLSYLAPEPVIYFKKKDPKFGYDKLTKPFKTADNSFGGRVFILINGGCFSSTGHLCALLKFHKIGRFIGSETGSTYTCNDFSKEVVLKNTRLKLRVARETFQVDVEGMDAERGIIPDFYVEPQIDDLINGTDTIIGV